MKSFAFAVSVLISPVALAAEVFSLNEIDPGTIAQGWGQAKIGRSVDDGPITMGGKVYGKGIGTHAASTIELELDGNADEFTAVVGASDRQKGTVSSMVFTVKGDGKELWNSGKMTPDTAPKPVSIKLAGVKKLLLLVSDAGDGIPYDHANWADASITYHGKPPHSGGDSISLTTDALSLNCSVGKDGALNVTSFRATDGSWNSPFSGPLFPGTTDCKYHDAPVAIRRANGDAALSLIYQDQITTEESKDIRHTVITLRDKTDPIFVDVHFRLFAKENVIQQWSVVRNDLAEPIRVEHLDSAYWQAPSASAPHLEWYDNRWGDEAPRPNLEKLAKGRRIIESRTGNRHIEGPVPAFIMSFGGFPDEEKSPCMIASLAWSGSMAMSFDQDNKDTFAAAVGVSSRNGAYTLDPKQSLTSPACIYTYSPAGKGQASRNLHLWARHYGMRDGNRLRLIDNNSWEGCQFDVKEDMVIDMIKGSAALGIELYVLDDGWFGNGPTARTGDSSGLGDWQVNQKLFPNGIARLVKAAKDVNVGFGLWFEPEMINPKSELFAKHPEWVLRSPGREMELERNQGVLDLTNPEVQDFVFKSVDDVLSANPDLRFVKWDANCSLHNPYAPHLAPTRQGDLLWRYFDGYYGSLKKLVEKHPNVDFQACSSGGGRADFGAMLNSHTFWVSDNTNPLFRLRAQWDISTFLPPMAATCHVTHSGNFKPKFRFDVSMMGQLGLEVDPRRAEPEFKAAAMTGIAAYKEVREIVQLGHQYRHASPFESTTPSLNYVSSDKSRALILTYQLADLKEAIAPVSGLDPEKTYELTEINLPAGDEQPRLGAITSRKKSGSAWMTEGIPLTFSRKNDSASLVLTATK
ncbi:MAG: alpha-galactosidase [Luteolibacter sp.]